MVEIKPLITEKTTNLAQKLNKYTFVVSPDVNKVEVAKQVAQMFSVKVISANVNNRLGHEVTWGSARKRIKGRRSDRKIVVLTLKAGDKISLFDA
jgi:large subunit ribosomal protein L23